MSEHDRTRADLLIAAEALGLNKYEFGKLLRRQAEQELGRVSRLVVDRNGPGTTLDRFDNIVAKARTLFFRALLAENDYHVRDL